MRRAAKIDSNHSEIVHALRAMGVSVQSLAAVGHGVPDLLAAYCGELFLLEVKMPNSKLTADEARWHGGWHSTVSIVRSVEDALRAVGLPME